MGQGSSKQNNGRRQGKAQPHWQSLASSSRTSTSSYDSWDSYPALIPSEACTELRTKQGMAVVSRLSRALDYIKKKVTRKESAVSERNGRKISGTLDVSESTDVEPCHRVKRLDELVNSTKFSREELQQMYRGFKNDYPTGIVNRETFKEMYTSLFPKGDCTLYANFMFSTFDTNNDGRITFEDFVIGLSESIHGNLDEKLKSMFRIYDVEKDGLLTRRELSKVLIAFYKMTRPDVIEEIGSSDGIRLMEEHVEELFQALDKNGDGLVTEESFIEACLTDKSLLKSLAVANQFDNMRDIFDDDSEKDIRSSWSFTSSYSRPDSISIALSPTLLCRNLNCNRSIPNLGEYRQRSALRVCDFELLEVRQRRVRCSTK